MITKYALIAAACLFGSAVHAQVPMQALVVQSCGTADRGMTPGQSGPVTVDVHGNICGTAGAQDTTMILPSSLSIAGVPPSSTGALAANQVIKNAPGNLYSLQVGADTTLSGAPWWLMVFDATAAPADGPVTPKKCIPVPSGTTSVSIAFQMPAYFTVGIVAGVSTTGCFTKTASTHAFISGEAQ